MKAYHSAVKQGIQFGLVLFVVVGIAHACDFATEPVAMQQFYRSAGWALPPMEHTTLSAPHHIRGKGVHIAGLQARRVFIKATTEDESDLFEIPRQEFEQDDKPRAMSSQLMVIERIVRWDIKGKIFAYTVVLTPVEGHRVNGKWQVDTIAGCYVDATFVDDRGDGVFRLLVPGEGLGGLDPNLVPQWVLNRKQRPA